MSSPRAKSPPVSAKRKLKSPKAKSPRAVAAKSPRARKVAAGQFPPTIGFERTAAKVAPRLLSAAGKPLPFYALLDNGGYTFVVFHDKEAGKVAVYRMTDDYDELNMGDFIDYHRAKVFTGVGKFFVGKSPKNPITTFSGAYGPKFDGNTVLFELGAKGKYVVFCYSFEEFTPEAEIVKYVSPVGNNGVSSPFALDKAGNFYVFGSKQLVVGAAGAQDRLFEEHWVELHNSKKKIPGFEKRTFATKTIIPRP